MSPSVRLPYAMFYLAVAMAVAGVALGVGAVEYEFAHVETIEDHDEADPVVERHGLERYEFLSEDEQALVDGALAGEVYRFESDAELPGRGTVDVGERFVVLKDGEYHVFTRRPVYAIWTPRGLLAALLVAVSPFVVADAIRRHHFPNLRLVGGFRNWLRSLR